MASVSTYLNFPGTTAQAFDFYRSVFGTDFVGGVMRMGDMPANPDMPLSEADQQLIMHIELPILAGHVIMATDMIESLGHQVALGNNMSINLQPDTVEECERLYAGLSEGATDVMPLTPMFWGLFGSFVDRFGVRWMFNCRTDAA